MKFTIGFEKEDTKKLHEYWDDIIEISNGQRENLPGYLKKSGLNIIS